LHVDRRRQLATALPNSANFAGKGLQRSLLLFRLRAVTEVTDQVVTPAAAATPCMISVAQSSFIVLPIAIAGGTSWFASR
jgi:hypothetical protein